MAQRGRKPTEKAKRNVIAVRATDQFREQIDLAAAANGRSMSQEIEARLQDSLRFDHELGGGEQARAIRLIAEIMTYVSERVGASWADDLTAFEIVTEAIDRLLFAYRPKDRDVAAPPRLERTPRIEKALADYKLAHAQWTQERRKGSLPVMKVLLAAHSGKEVTPEDRAAAAKGHEVLDGFPDAPVPDLTPEELSIWRREQDYDWQIKVARDLANSLSIPVARQRGREWPSVSPA